MATKCAVKQIQFVLLALARTIEEELKKFPIARVVRMDSDTTSKRGSHDKLLTKF